MARAHVHIWQVCLVLRVDRATGYIDLSKWRVPMSIYGRSASSCAWTAPRDTSTSPNGACPCPYMAGLPRPARGPRHGIHRPLQMARAHVHIWQVCLVLRVDRATGYIDLSKWRVPMSIYGRSASSCAWTAP